VRSKRKKKKLRELRTKIKEEEREDLTRKGERYRIKSEASKGSHVNQNEGETPFGQQTTPTFAMEKIAG